MNTSDMKSNISFQPEGRLIPRRKVTTKSHLLNGVGDYDIQFRLAIQESLKYVSSEQTHSSDGDKLNDLDSSNRSNLLKIEVPADTEGQSDQPRKTERNKTTDIRLDESEEMSRLKDLLLSHMDLLQCQQDELNKKDKEIKSLIAAKHTLQCRLERMERRLSIMKQREVSREGIALGNTQSSTALDPNVKTHKSYDCDLSRIELTKRQSKQRRRNNRYSHIKKRKSLSELPSTSNALSDENEISNASDMEENDKTSEEESDSDTGTEDDERMKGIHDETRDKSPLRQDIKLIDYPIMQTDIMYHLYYPKHACPSSPDAKKIQEQLEVETPSWRLKPLTNMYQLEGTENITDEAYNLRHQKFEHEEKRRKRWDLQRMRELQQLEKLERQKEEELRASQDEADMETFLPSVLDLKHIEITEAVPVMAFGQPIPFICPGEFELSWDMDNPPSNGAVSKPKPSASISRR